MATSCLQFASSQSNIHFSKEIIITEFVKEAFLIIYYALNTRVEILATFSAVLQLKAILNVIVISWQDQCRS